MPKGGANVNKAAKNMNRQNSCLTVLLLLAV